MEEPGSCWQQGVGQGQGGLLMRRNSQQGGCRAASCDTPTLWGVSVRTCVCLCVHACVCSHVRAHVCVHV